MTSFYSGCWDGFTTTRGELGWWRQTRPLNLVSELTSCLLGLILAITSYLLDLVFEIASCLGDPILSCSVNVLLEKKPLFQDLIVKLLFSNLTKIHTTSEVEV